MKNQYDIHNTWESLENRPDHKFWNCKSCNKLSRWGRHQSPAKYDEIFKATGPRWAERTASRLKEMKKMAKM